MAIGSKLAIKSFTLVELLIVIAILAVLAAAVVVVLNPAELLAQARDSQRVTDMKTLNDAVNLFIVDNPSASLGTAQTVYISIPDTSTTCANISGLPTLPAGWAYRCVTTANLRNIDGTGWIPINLTTVKGGSPVPYLPIDPQNDQALTKYYQYIPASSTYELSSLLESEKQGRVAANDGGFDLGRLEIGSDISLWKTASGIAGLWSFEGTGSITNGQTVGLQDFSGNNNNGTASNVNGSGMAFSAGRSGNAVQFDGVDDTINISDNPSLNFGSGSFSYGLWYYSNASVGLYDMPWYKGGSSATNPGYDMELGTSGWTALISDGTIYRSVSFGNESLGQWKHLVVVCDRTAGYVYGYVNGVRYSQSGISTLGSTSTTTAVGISPASYKVNGKIDEVMVYNRALSASEIRAIYNATK